MKLGTIKSQVLCERSSSNGVRYLLIEPDNKEDPNVIVQAEGDNGDILFKRKTSFASAASTITAMFDTIPTAFENEGDDRESGPTNNALDVIVHKEEDKKRKKIRKTLMLRNTNESLPEGKNETHLTNQENFGHSGRDEYNGGETGLTDGEGKGDRRGKEEGSRPSRNLGDSPLSDNGDEEKTYNHENPSFTPTQQETDAKMKMMDEMRHRKKVRDRNIDKRTVNVLDRIDNRGLILRKVKM
jgi:hypothetical protein